MPSITYWSRIEPRPRTRSLADSFAARVRDPLWLLTRQWQTGEFRGEDAGSPAFADVTALLGRLQSWRVDGGEAAPIQESAPLEPVVLDEGFEDADLSLAVELGQIFEQALSVAGGSHLVAAFRDAFPLGGEGDQPDEHDTDALRFLRVVAGRGTHGVRLHRAAELARPGLPAEPQLAPDDTNIVRAAVDELRVWVAQSVGRIGHEDAAAWDPGRLEYRLEVLGGGPRGRQVALSAHPGRDGSFEWYAFDMVGRDGTGDIPVEVMRRSALPGNVTFRGMPNKRWWRFEAGTANLAAVRPERRELAKLVVLDFVLVHGNDWYVLPLRLPRGSLCAIDAFVVHDVFGELTQVERADRDSTGGRWTMFSHVLPGGGPTADLFMVPPAAGFATQEGEPLEEVHFVRDEAANMAWAIERVVENAVGEPWPAQERSAAVIAGNPRSAPTSGPPRYMIQTTVPDHWFPFVPVAIDPPRPDIRLEEGVLLRSAAEQQPRAPMGRILRPTRLGAAPYRLPEEEISRLGERVVRTVHRARWTDGSTHVWIARRTLLGAGEGRSGLAFDVITEPIEE